MRSVETASGLFIKCVCDCGLCGSARGVYRHCSACRIGRWRDGLVKSDEYDNAREMWKLIRERQIR
jgi:hypothetical protein